MLKRAIKDQKHMQKCPSTTLRSYYKIIHRVRASASLRALASIAILNVRGTWWFTTSESFAISEGRVEWRWRESNPRAIEICRLLLR